MSRRVVIPVVSAAVLLSSNLSGQTATTYQVLANWGHKLPGTSLPEAPAVASSERERAEMRARGNVTALSQQSGFAGVCVDSRDRVYAFRRDYRGVEAGRQAVVRERPLVVWDRNGSLVQWERDGIPDDLIMPRMCEIDEGDHLWVADTQNHRVLKMSPTFDRVLLQLGVTGEPGEDARHLNLPADVTWSKRGDIFVADGYGNNRVVKFSKDGTYLKAWGGGPNAKGSADGRFHLPQSITVDGADRLYVVDRENRRVQIFDTDGNFLGKWTHVGNPWGIEIWREGREEFAFLTDHATEQVIKVRVSDGSIVTRFGGPGRRPGEFDWAHGIAIDSSGAVYVSDTYGQRIQKFAPAGPTPRR